MPAEAWKIFSARLRLRHRFPPLSSEKQIYSGSTGTSGEFGHMTIDKSGPLCDCGCYGCLEAIASANAISKQARFAISNGANP